MIYFLSIIAVFILLYSILTTVIIWYIRKNKKPDFRLKPHHDIELAFEVGGRRFYRFKNEMNLPVERALSVKDYYEELECRVDKDYLKLLFDQLTALLDKGKIVSASHLIEIAKSRLEHITNAELVYKLASVSYFSEDEDPYSYDLAKGDEKIAFWKQHDLDAFFLKTHLSEFLPSFKSLGVSLENYLKMAAEDIQRGLAYHSSLLSEMPEKADLQATIEQQWQAVTHYLNYSDSPTSNT